MSKLTRAVLARIAALRAEGAGGWSTTPRWKRYAAATVPLLLAGALAATLVLSSDARTQPTSGGADRHAAGRAAAGGRHAAGRATGARGNGDDPGHRAPAVPGRSGADRPPRQPRAGRRLRAAARRQGHLARRRHAQLERDAGDRELDRGHGRHAGRRAPGDDLEPGASGHRRHAPRGPGRVDRFARVAPLLAQPTDWLNPARTGQPHPLDLPGSGQQSTDRRDPPGAGRDRRVAAEPGPERTAAAAERDRPDRLDSSAARQPHRAEVPVPGRQPADRLDPDPAALADRA